MSLLSFSLAHSLPEVAAGLTPVHQWKRDASDKNTCNYPPTLLSLGGDWTAGPFPTRKGTAHGQTCQSPAKPSITADTVPSTCSQTLQQAPPTWDPTWAASPVKCGLGELDGRSTPASLYAQTGTAQPDSDAHPVTKVSNSHSPVRALTNWQRGGSQKHCTPYFTSQPSVSRPNSDVNFINTWWIPFFPPNKHLYHHWFSYWWIKTRIILNVSRSKKLGHCVKQITQKMIIC